MPRIHHSALTIATDRPEDRATVTVSCDIEFTEVEVNAMNLLGLRYTLHCHVLNKELLDENSVINYEHREFPRVSGEAREHEHVVFETKARMYTMNERLFGKDKLVAELRLRNEETNEEVVQRTEEIAVDLAA